MKKLLLIIFSWLIFLIPAFAQDIPQDAAVTVLEHTGSGYYIKNYDVDMVVDKDKSVRVTEDIDVYFENDHHGIYREIPVFPNKITDVNVSEQYRTSMNGDDLNIKIGDPYTTIKGDKHYKIRYTYHFLNNKNEFYYNIIGTNWAVPINRASFNLTMPSTVDPSKVGLSIGKYGTKGFSGGAEFSVNGNKISGKTHKALNPGEGITIRIEVHSGYFNVNLNYIKILSVALIVIFTLISFLIWHRYGKDEPVIPVVNFYPPKGMDSGEVELGYRGFFTKKGLISLIIYLASKGYLKIYDKEKSFTITKLKEYTGGSEALKDLMMALFPYNQMAITKEELEESGTFYKDCEKIIKNFNKRRNIIFFKDSVSLPLQILMCTCLFIVGVLTLFSVYDFRIVDYLLGDRVMFKLLIMPLCGVISLVMTWTQSGEAGMQWNKIWGAVVWVVVPIGLVLGIGHFYNLPEVLFGVACTVVCAVCAYQLPKRNKVGQNLLNNLMGLKNFIRVAEKNRIKLLVSRDPEYFYNILPYAYVLDVEDEWIKKFEDIMQIQPDWYEGERFNTKRFRRFVDDMNTLSSPSVANGGISTSSSGGGGHAGGGGGGGGGGGW
ncbi:DUF2207 domain-containing protein [bacterium]|nr:DUF2207 domain-containing protein [bacterium]